MYRPERNNKNCQSMAIFLINNFENCWFFEWQLPTLIAVLFVLWLIIFPIDFDNVSKQ